MDRFTVTVARYCLADDNYWCIELVYTLQLGQSSYSWSACTSAMATKGLALLEAKNKSFQVIFEVVEGWL